MGQVFDSRSFEAQCEEEKEKLLDTNFKVYIINTYRFYNSIGISHIISIMI